MAAVNGTQTQQRLDALEQRMNKYDDILDKLQLSMAQIAIAVALLGEKVKHNREWTMFALSIAGIVFGAVLGAVLSYVLTR